MGRWVDGIRWEFRNGQLVKYSAKASAESFSSIYEKADGDKNHLGRIGIGANPKIRRGFLQDSMSSGAITIWLGNNQDFGGTNRTGFMFPGVLGNATMSIDGHAIVEKGKLHRDMTPAGIAKTTAR
jgi:leucyl aminopeptidase (aminopeptidase T)